MTQRVCSNCGVQWPDRERFLSDPRIRVVGYQPNFRSLSDGLFYFNHSCGTTLAFKAGEFADLYDGPMFGDRKTGGPDCLGYCLRSYELRLCAAKCECAFVRNVLNLIRNHPKRPASS